MKTWWYFCFRHFRYLDTIKLSSWLYSSLHFLHWIIIWIYSFLSLQRFLTYAAVYVCTELYIILLDLKLDINDIISFCNFIFLSILLDLSMLIPVASVFTDTFLCQYINIPQYICPYYCWWMNQFFLFLDNIKSSNTFPWEVLSVYQFKSSFHVHA